MSGPAGSAGFAESARVAVELPKAFRLLNHGPTVLVSSAHGGRRNLMAAAWSMPVDYTPAKVAVVIDKTSYTRELIDASGEFALNVPSRAQAALTLAAGSVSGRDLGRDIAGESGAEWPDKFAKVGAGATAASRIGAPLVEGCLAWLECRVIREPHNQQTHDLFIAEVLAAWADPRVFVDGRWQFGDDAQQRSIHYIAGGAFFATGEAFQV